MKKSNEVYKTGHLNTPCFYQWIDFFKRELFPCTIAPLSAFFNGCIDMVAFESGFIYTKIKASPYRVYFKRKQPCDYFYIIATNGAISWVNKNKEIKSLPLGGVAVFDCNDVISYSVESEHYVTSFLVPYCYLARGKYKVEAKGKQSLHYETLISELVYNTQPEDNDLLFKMRAVANLLFIHSHAQVVTCQQNEEFNQIISFIHENTLNHDMDLLFISRELGMSKSKIQKILRVNNVSYRDVIKESRVKILAGKLKRHKGVGVAQLCYGAGFNSLSNAAVQFKKVMNVSIPEYRKKYTDE